MHNTDRQFLSLTIVCGIAVVLLGIRTICIADTLILKDGRKLDGRLVSEDDHAITFEFKQAGASLRARYLKTKVQSVTTERREGPSYYPLPIIGPIGSDRSSQTYVTADSFRKAITQVRRAKPDYVILVIDSPGGSVAELENIVAVIEDAKDDFQFIAYVKNQAISAAAVIAMTCPTIVMKPDATIGAAVPYQIGPDGTPRNIEEKFQSIERASFRAAVQSGGHSPLLMRGMMETDIELVVSSRGGKPVVSEAGPGVDGEILKSRGKILTLTAREAKRCGLSTATVNSPDDLKTTLGLKAWHMMDDRAWFTIINQAKAERLQRIKQLQQARRTAARQAYIERIQPEISRLETRLTQLRAKLSACADSERQLVQQWNRELAIADSDYQYSLQQARYSDNPQYWMNDAGNAYDQKVASIKNRLEPLLASVRHESKEAEYERRQLTARLNRLIRSIPDD